MTNIYRSLLHEKIIFRLTRMGLKVSDFCRLYDYVPQRLNTIFISGANGSNVKTIMSLASALKVNPGNLLDNVNIDEFIKHELKENEPNPLEEVLF